MRHPSLRSDEGGYSLVELITVLSIFGTVMGALMSLFVSATKAELDMNRRFEAQQSARVALARLRREAHCATEVDPAGPAATVQITLPHYCKLSGNTGSPLVVTWCTIAVTVSPPRYRLHRSTTDPCGASDPVYADHLTSPTVFDHTLQSSASLAKLSVILPVNVDPTKPGAYTLTDTLVMRNTRRECVTGSPAPC